MASSPRDKTSKQQMLLQDFIDGKDFSALDISHKTDTTNLGNHQAFLHPPPIAHANSPLHPSTTTINVNGTRFDVSQETFCRLAPRLLAMGAKVITTESTGGYLVPTNSQDKDAYSTKINQVKAQENGISFGITAAPPAQEYFVERHAPSFVHILDYFQHGELHLPPDVCPYVFRRELNHWGVDPTAMSDCCQRKYLSFLDDQETLRHFNESFVGTNYQSASVISGKHPSAWSQLRMRVWSILDDPTSSVWAKMYITLAVLFVVLSVFVLVASTDNAFKRGLTTDEWLEYFDEDEKLMYGGLLGINYNKDDGDDHKDKDRDKNHNNDDDDDYNYTDDYTIPTEETALPPNTTYNEITVDTTQNPGMNDTTQLSASHGSDSAQSHGSKKVGKRSVRDRYEIQRDPIAGVQRVENDQQPFKTKDLKPQTSKDVRGRRHRIPKTSLPKKNRIKETPAKWRSIKNMRNLVESLMNSLSQLKIDGDDLEFTDSEELQFEMRVIQTIDKVKQAKLERTRFSRNDYAENGVPTLYTQQANQANDNGKDDTQQGSKNSGNIDAISEEQDESEHDPINILHVRHRRGASNNDNSNNTNSNNQTSEIDSKSCYKITGRELHNLIGYAYVSGTYTTSSATVTTQLPQDVFTVKDWISKIEMACIVYFTIEFLLRIIFCPSKPQFLINFFTIVDILSLASMYAVLLLHHFNTKTKYTATYVDIINCLQVVRVFRFFRLVKDVTGFRVLIFSVRTSWRELLLLLLYIIMLVSIFASLVYYCERQNMGSILRSAWWAIVTMTTVGYGDIAPRTSLGRFVGAICALSGVLLIAVTVPVFVNNFLLFYEHSKIMDQQVNRTKSHDDRREEKEDHQPRGRKLDRINSASTSSTCTSFSRQHSTLSTTQTPVETLDISKSAFSFTNDENSPRYSTENTLRQKTQSGKGSQVSFTKVQPVM